MKKYCNNKDINKIVLRLLKQGWSVKDGKKHRRLISPVGDKFSIPSTPSDYRAKYNFCNMIKLIDCR